MRFPTVLIFAHLRRNWFRSLLTLGSVFVAVLTFEALQTVVASIEVAATGVGSTRLITESAASLFVTLPRKLDQQISQIPGVKTTTHLTWFGGVFISEKFFFARFGADPLALRDVYKSDIYMPEEQWQKFAATRTGCIIGVDLAERFDWTIGSKIALQGNLFPGNYELEVVGLYKSLTPSYDQSTLYMRWDYMNEVSKAHDGPVEKISVFATLLETPENASNIAATVDSLFDNSSNRTRTLLERAFQAQFVSMWGGLPTFFNFISIVAVIATFLVTLNTMVLNTRERVKEVGVLKTLGFTDGTVTLLGLTESLLICLIGGAFACRIMPSLDGKVIPGLQLPIYVPPHLASVGLALAGLLGLAAGIVPAITAGKLPIVDALRRRA